MSIHDSESFLPPSRRVPFRFQMIIWIGLLVLLAILGGSLLNAQQSILAIGSPVPDFTLTLFEGYEYQGASQVSLADLHGKVVVFNFWASWCSTCKSEAFDLEEAWRFYQQGDKTVFIGVDYVDTDSKGLSYLAKYDITFPNGPDLGMSISRIFNRNMGVPETYIVDREGILRFIKIGPFQSVEEIKSLINSFLSEE